MLNENTRHVLKTLTSIGNNAIVRFPVTTIAQKDKSLIAFVNLETLGEESFTEYGISYLSDFLSLVDFYSDAVIENNNGIIDMKTETSHQRYRSTDLEMMKAYDISGNLIDNIAKVDPCIKFDISADELSRFKKIANLVKSDFFVIGASTITVCKLDATNTKLDESTTDVLMSTTEDAQDIVINMSAIDKLPSGNYEVKITKNASSGNFISVWSSADQPINIVVAVAKAI